MCCRPKTADSTLVVAVGTKQYSKNNHTSQATNGAGEDDQQAAEATWLSCNNENRKSDNDNQRLSVGST
jgi:hypothetical protein